MKTHIRSAAFLSFLFLIKVSSMYAQDLKIPLIENDEKSLNNIGAQKTANAVNPAIRSGVISSLSSVSLTSLFNDTRAEVKVALNAGGSIFNMGVAQSFSEKPKTASLFDFDGLNTGSTFSFAWQKRIGKIKIPTELPVLDVKKFIVLKEEVKKKKKIDDELDVEFSDFDTELRNKAFNSGAINLESFATPLLFTFQFSATRVGFEYIADRLSTNPLSSEEINKNYTFSISKFTSLDIYYSLSYSVLYTHQSGNEVISYSFPVGSNGLSYSKEVTVGTPVEKIDSKLKGELRQLFRSNDFTPVLGINPSISLLFKSERANIDLPIYFLTKNDAGLFNGLQAGFRVGYTSKWDDSFFRDLGSFNTSKMYFSLFLTKPFSVNN